MNLYLNNLMQIGISIAKTGPLSLMGRQALKGIQLWVADLQKKGGLRFGEKLMPVQLIVRDDESRTTLARENLQNLINEHGVDVLVGPYSSHLTKAAAQICSAHQRLLWNHGGASDEISQTESNWIVSTLSPASQYLHKLPRWIAANDSYADDYLVLSSPKGTFASNVVAGLSEASRTLATPVRLRSATLPETTDRFIQLLNDAAPKVLVLVGTFEQETGFLRTRNAWPKSIRHVAGISAGVRHFLDSVGTLAEDIIGPSQWEPAVPRVRLIGPTSAQFVNDFTNSFHEMPDYPAAGAFATGLIIEECIRRAGSCAESTLRQSACDLQTETFYGRFQIDESGRQTGHEIQLVQWQKAKKIVLT